MSKTKSKRAKNDAAMWAQIRDIQPDGSIKKRRKPAKKRKAVTKSNRKPIKRRRLLRVLPRQAALAIAYSYAVGARQPRIRERTRLYYEKKAARYFKMAGGKPKYNPSTSWGKAVVAATKRSKK